MAKEKDEEGAKFVRYFGPLLDALRGLGGSAKAEADRADKGIIVTTGSFTAEARREATRDGAHPIELIDGEKLLDMLEKLELGLKPVTTYEVEHAFFKEFEA